MDVFWYALTGLLLAGYLALESVDFGMGMLFWFARTERDRERARRAVVPLFLANEVWLVAFVGLLLGALPLLEGELLTALRVPVVMVLGAWVLRDAALWFRTALPSGGWRRLWDVVLPVASLVLALVWGTLLAALIRGLSTDGNGRAVAVLSDLVDPFSLACAAVVVVGSLRQGVLFAARRLPEADPDQIRLAGLAGRLHWPLVGLALLAAVAAAGVTGAPVAVILVGVAAAVGTYASERLRTAGRPGAALLLGTAPLVALPAAIGVVNGTTVLATRSGEGALTLSEAIADSASLGLLAVGVLPVLAAVAFGQVWMWRVFAPRGARAR
ncbi:MULTISPECIES: cytochrome d ubiquinol oxidase subunit II [unclassified Streptomyces]|uniref:cytochrome d ubiquinol oxidase subunit II n=1 Tax=unclassified Streptomyces TaxID=2593676 RepID=UPI002E2B45B0|nr:cytochrome d ubiquinol oxidase subunit II [Streptomyces sp. NBC_00273]